MVNFIGDAHLLSALFCITPANNGCNVGIALICDDTLSVIVHGLLHARCDASHIRNHGHLGPNLVIPLKQLDGIEAPLRLRHISSDALFDFLQSRLHIGAEFVYRYRCSAVPCKLHCLVGGLHDAGAL